MERASPDTEIEPCLLDRYSLLTPIGLANTALDRKLYINNHALNYKGGVYVAKKKRRYDKRYKRVYHSPKTPYDVHHLLWTGRKWGYGYLASLRQYWYCKIEIKRDTLHRYIHENISMIPTPRPQSAKDALSQLQYLDKYGALHNDDTIEKRLELLIALFECVEPRTANGLKRELEIVHEFNDNPP